MKSISFLKGVRVLCLCLPLLLFSCKKEDTSAIYTLRQWKVDLTTGNVLPAISGRTDHAVAVFYLMTDNKLYYYLYFDSPLNNNDVPLKGSIYTGANGTSGTVLIELANEAFDANREVKGAVELSQQVIADLNTKTNYLQISSSQQPNGLVRGAMQSY
ncbi:CHRD domain-containing protein [Pedobacter endophyticus]|uniref:CHRD domain-containing protein n=1 Tax=Pedobacter endophyticus TaxID=2789740 RepID=A0A7S9L1L4_9SPHI|nr:CHRD domain-containing protein [Pedobacter endophyticus]QPH40839.1 CHRD domain-containing protein [Pedobacter endophyticus]